MKLVYITFLLITTLLHLTKGEYGLDHPIFLVSRITEEKKWCLTADENANNVSLELCDFDAELPSQIWYRTDDENLLTSIVPIDDGVNKNNRCLTAKDGNVYIDQCESEDVSGTNAQRFDTWPSDRQRIQIESTSGNTGCVAAEDATAGGQITLLSCDDDSDRTYWRFHYVSCEPFKGGSGYERICYKEGCMKAFNAGDLNDSNQVKVVDDPYGDLWKFDGETADAVCFGTGLTRYVLFL